MRLRTSLFSQAGRHFPRCAQRSWARPVGESPTRGDARVPGSWLPASGESPPSKRSDKPRSAGCKLAVRSMKRILQRRSARPSNGPQEGAEPLAEWVKAMEDASGPGAGVEEPSGVRGSERQHGRVRNWGEPPRPGTRCGSRKRSLPITDNREVAGGREAVGGGCSSDDDRDNTTRPERRAPASSHAWDGGTSG
jgi:hypothetical protein